MTLEEAMKREIIRLEEEINGIDADLKKLEIKIQKLNMDRQKKIHDFKALTNSFDESQVDKESLELLERIIRGERIVKA